MSPRRRGGLLTIRELNALDREPFVAAIGWVFERSPWVAERSWAERPFADTESLHAVMVRKVMEARPEEQLALLGAHPDLGTRARIGAASAGEQAGAGLDRLTPDEFGILESLNSAYRSKFGFPFLFAVRGGTKYDVLKALEKRLGASPEEEYGEALRQVYRIAGFRLRDAVKAA